MNPTLKYYKQKVKKMSRVPSSDQRKIFAMAKLLAKVDIEQAL